VFASLRSCRPRYRPMTSVPDLPCRATAIPSPLARSGEEAHNVRQETGLRCPPHPRPQRPKSSRSKSACAVMTPVAPSRVPRAARPRERSAPIALRAPRVAARDPKNQPSAQTAENFIGASGGGVQSKPRCPTVESGKSIREIPGHRKRGG
jgi:hypothetical protein